MKKYVSRVYRDQNHIPLTSWWRYGVHPVHQDCHTHSFRVEESSNAWIFGQVGQCMHNLEHQFHSRRDIELC